MSYWLPILFLDMVIAFLFRLRTLTIVCRLLMAVTERRGGVTGERIGARERSARAQRAESS
jgi:hypothetical protein